MKSTAPDLYTSVTLQIITALEAGTAPWICPWRRGGLGLPPANLSTGRPYRGINTLLLNLRASANGYNLNRWITFQQARALGGNVRRGESGTQVIFFKMNDLKAKDDQSTRAANDEPTRRVIPLMRSFTVFNAAQVDGLPQALTALPSPPDEWNPVVAAESLLDRSGAVIRHAGDHAFYRFSDDLIQLPPQRMFATPEDYYGTALHELTHWTGHPSRCNRPLSGRQHIEAYAFEELVAEMGSAFLNSHCGIAGELQHASYIASWLDALRNDRRLIFSAASLAQRAVDFLIGEQDSLPGSGQRVAPSDTRLKEVA